MLYAVLSHSTTSARYYTEQVSGAKTDGCFEEGISHYCTFPSLTKKSITLHYSATVCLLAKKTYKYFFIRRCDKSTAITSCFYASSSPRLESSTTTLPSHHLTTLLPSTSTQRLINVTI